MKDINFSVLGLVVLVACSSESGTPVTANPDAGGTSNVGGSTGLGGTSATTGNSSGGATLAAAGSPTGGAANSVGGLANDSGGVSSIGGTSTAVGAGGTIAVGGTVSVGGAVSSGGSLGLGGTPATGGAAIGGASTTGGTPATGGAPTTSGGMTATGGTATGGAPTTGGSPATGGTATGGTATGGTATGGAATGGTAMGGAATGGAATGGAATGGAATGGAATGGAATGGAATGGTTTGGTTCPLPASLSDPQFVDPAAGTDDDKHGGALGACAYKTLTYALAHATGQIALPAATTYSPTTETFPIILTGNQQLLCAATSTVIQGKGLDTATGYQTTVVFRGTRNALNNCKVDGNGGGGYCVHITASGSSSSSPHTITGSDIGNCGGTAITIRNANNVTVTTSSIHNSQIGVSWLGPNTGGSMLNNTFKANSIADIQCSVADPGVTGSGNTALGVLYCSQCGNCPF